ncbi:MAG TPA: transposase [Armatimonadota bacterium]|nr:transposase [Armatimonadota bacterium]
MPHWEEPGATYFLRFGLQRPAVVDLTVPEIGRLVVGALKHWDGDRYVLYDYTVMPDHVHAILRPIVDAHSAEQLSRILGPLKGWLARQINALVGRQGPLWQAETYDHIIRDDADYLARAGYIFDNPHTEGLIADPLDWPWWGRGSGATE